MAISFTNLGTNANPDIETGSNLDTYSTTSWTPPTTGVIVAFVRFRTSPEDHELPNLTGNSLTWHNIWYEQAQSGSIATALYAAFASGATTGITSFDMQGRTGTYFNASFFQITGAYESGGIQDVFVQLVEGFGTGTSGSITLPAAAHSNNRVFAGFAHLTAEANTPRTNWTELDDFGNGDGLITEYRGDAHETTASASWSTNEDWVGIAVEVREAAATGISGRSMPYWRLREDDTLALSSTTFAAAENTAANIKLGQDFRVRIKVSRDNTGAAETYKLQSRWVPASGMPTGWDDVAVVASGTHGGPVLGKLSSQYADGAATTELLTTDNTWEAGEGIEGDPQTGNVISKSIDLDAESTEFEWCIQAVSSTGSPAIRFPKAGDKIYLRVVVDDTSRFGQAFENPYNEVEINLVQNNNYVGYTMAENPNDVIHQDTNYNIYYLAENAEFNADITMYKSSDRGVTWAPVDHENRPAVRDLEALDIHQDGTTLHCFFQKNNEPYYQPFYTSDHSTTPDTWGTEQVVKDPVTRDDQEVAGVWRSDGTAIIFFEELISSQRRITYRIRSSGGTWGSDNSLDSTASIDFTDVWAVLGASDLTHIFYVDLTNGKLYHNTINSSDTLGTKEEVGTSVLSTASADARPIVGVVRYDSSGTDRVVCVYKGSDDALHSTKVDDNGSPSSPATVSDNDTAHDSTGSGWDAPIAMLARDGTDLYVIYADITTADFYLTKSADYGAWNTDVEIQDGVGEPTFLRGALIQTSGGGKYIGYIYEEKSHGGNGQGWYREYMIDSGDINVTPAAATAATSVDSRVQQGLLYTVDLEEGTTADFDSTQDSSNIAINSTAAMVGSYGAQITFDTANPHGLITSSIPLPFRSDEIRIRFYFDPNGLSMTAGDEFYLMWARADGTLDSINNLFDIRIHESGADYDVQIRTKEDDSSNTFMTLTALSDAEHYIEVYCKRASSPTASDGEISAWLDGTLMTGGVTNLDNFDLWDTLYQLKFGVALGGDVGTSGTFFLDDIIIRDDNTTIGAAVSGIDVTPAAATAKTSSFQSVSIGRILEVDLEEGTTGDFDSVSGGLTISTDAGIVGTYGVDIDATVAAGADTHGNNVISNFASKYIRFRFYVDVTNLTMTSGDSLYLLSLWSSYVPATELTARVRLIHDGTNVEVILNTREDSGTDRATSASDANAALTGEHYIEGYIIRESYDGAADGEHHLWVDGTLIAGSDYDVTNFNAFNGFDETRLGADSLDVGTTGDLFLDDLIINDDGSVIGAAPSGIDITPAAVTGAVASTNPTVQLSSVSVTPSAGTAAAVSTAPTTQLGSINVSPTLADASAIGADPTVTLSGAKAQVSWTRLAFPRTETEPINITPTAVDGSAVGTDPTVRLGSINITPTLADASAIGTDPGTQLGSINITPAAATAAVSSTDPSVQQDSMNVSPALVSATATGTDPTTHQGDIDLTPTGGTSTASSTDPAVRLGSISITPAAGTATATGADPTVDNNVYITPTAADASAVGTDPTVQLGSVSVTPTEVTASVASTDPTVRFGSINITPTAGTASVASTAPTTQLGSINVTPAAADASAVGTDPTVQEPRAQVSWARLVYPDAEGVGDINVYPAAGTAAAASTNPTVQQSSINVSPTAGTASVASTDPSVNLGDANVTPAAASASASSTDPSVQQDSMNVTPAASTATAASTAPTTQLGSLNITPTAATAAVTGADPTVSNNVNIIPAAAVAGADSVGPSEVRQGSINITPSAGVAGADSFLSETRLGSVSVTPTAADASAVGTDPSVDISSGNVNVTPAAGTATAASTSPTVQLGSLSITPAVGDASAIGTDPTVQLGDINVSPALVSAAASSTDPTVQITSGDVNVTPAASTAAASSTNPTTQQGSINITPALSTASAVGTDPTVQLSSVSVTPAVATAACSGADPEVPIYVPVYPSAAVAGTDGVDPSLHWGSMSYTPAPAAAATASARGPVNEGDAFSVSPAVAATSSSYTEVQGGNNRALVTFARVLLPVSTTNIQVFADPASSVASTTGPTVNFSSDSATPDPASAGTSVENPTISLSDVTVATSPSFAVTESTDPTVDFSGDSASPAPASASAAATDPTFQYGDINTTAGTNAVARAQGTDPDVDAGFEYGPAASTASAASTDPSVLLGDFSRTPPPASASTETSGPSLYWGSQQSTPSSAQAGTSTSLLLVQEGNATVTPAPASAVTATTGPEVVQWSLFLTITDVAVARTATKIGSVVEGGGFLDIYPVEAYAQAATSRGDVLEDPAAPEWPTSAAAETGTDGPEVQITGGYVEIRPTPAQAHARVSYQWFQVRLGDLNATGIAAASTSSQVGEARQHSIWLAPWEKGAGTATTGPAVELSSLSLSPAPAVAKTDSARTVQQGDLNVAPSAGTAAVSSVPPTVEFWGGYTAITPSSAQISAVSSILNVTYGNISVTPEPATAKASVLVGVIIDFGDTQATPAPATSKTRVVGPMIRMTAISLSPITASAATSASGPTVFLGPEEVFPDPVFTRAATLGPTVGLGSHSISTTPATVTVASVAPTVHFGSVTISPSAATAIAVSVAPEYVTLANLYPDEDDGIGSWTDEGGETTELFDSLDERPDPDSQDFIKNETPAGEVYRTDLENVVDPGRDDHHYIEYAISKGTSVSQIDLTVILKEGETTIATWVHVDVPVQEVVVKQTLTTLQAQAITDYSDLHLEFSAVEV